MSQSSTLATTPRILSPVNIYVCASVFEKFSLVIENADYRGVNTNQRGESVLFMILNSIWWWGYSIKTFGKVEYSFIAITPWSTLTRISSNS